MLNSNTAQLAALLVESIIYGVYLVTFAHCLLALFRGPTAFKRPAEIKLAPLFVALSLFCLGTTNLALAFYRIVDVQAHAALGAATYVGPGWLTIVKVSTMNLQVLIADGALIYRCWQVYGKASRVILLPLALWAGDFGFAIYIAWTQQKHSTENGSVNKMLNLECTIFWGITILLNIYATNAIVLRIWRVDRRSRALELEPPAPSPDPPSTACVRKEKTKTKLQEIIGIVIDSGLIYTACSFAVFMSQVVNSDFVYITSSADMMVVGITFNLIIIRVARARNRERGPEDGDSKALTTIQFNFDLASRLSRYESTRRRSRSVKSSRSLSLDSRMEFREGSLAPSTISDDRESAVLKHF